MVIAVALPSPGSVPVNHSARVIAEAVSVAEAVNVTVVAPWVGFGVTDTELTVGRTLSMTSATDATGPQLPAPSLACTNTVCTPSASSATVAAGTVASRLAVGAGELTVIGVPEPSAPTVSRKYSAAAMADPPVAVSSPVACRATAAEPLVGVGDSVGEVVAGPAVSPPVNRTELKTPQVPSASWPRTKRMC